MPITQSRMIRLIDACSEILGGYQKLVKNAEEQRKQLALDVAQGINRDPQAEVESLIAAIIASRPSIEAISAIASETAHFNARRKVNDRAKDYMQQHRKRPLAEEPTAEPLKNLEFNGEIDLNNLQTITYRIWKSSGKPLIYSAEIGDLVSKLGERDIDKQNQIISQMIAEGRLEETRFPGEYTVVEPTEK